VSATNPGVFEAVSIAAARSWTYRPALKNGKPVAGAVRIPITFAMDESDDVTETAR
jgi:outer membrane biosynthesis protein TonB